MLIRSNSKPRSGCPPSMSCAQNTRRCARRPWIRWRSPAHWNSKASATNAAHGTALPTCSRSPRKCTCGCPGAGRTGPPRILAGRQQIAAAAAGLLYGLPGVCFPAAAGAARRAGRGERADHGAARRLVDRARAGLPGLPAAGPDMDMDQARRVLRAGLVGRARVLGAAHGGHRAAWHARLGVTCSASARELHAGRLRAAGARRRDWLLAALAPGVLGSAAFMALGRPPQLEHEAWAALALTPLLALALAVIAHLPSPPARRGRLFGRAELRGALPTAAFGLVAAGLLAFPVVAGPRPARRVNTGALLAALPCRSAWARPREPAVVPPAHAAAAALQPEPERVRRPVPAGAGRRAAPVPGGGRGADRHAVAIGGRPAWLHSKQAVLPELAVYLALGGRCSPRCSCRPR